MKKLLFTLCCMIFAIASFAQSNVHIKFMGIPVTGTIAQFQAKLVAKGCTYNKVASASISNGTRAFKGTFVGNKVDIYVYYDTNTKIVYRTKAVVSGVSEDIAEQEYSKVKKLLSQKYVEITVKMQSCLIKGADGQIKLNSYGQMLAIERSRLIAGVAGKLEALKELVINNKLYSSRDLLVYCGAVSNELLSDQNY